TAHRELIGDRVDRRNRWDHCSHIDIIKPCQSMLTEYGDVVIMEREHHLYLMFFAYSMDSFNISWGLNRWQPDRDISMLEGGCVWIQITGNDLQGYAGELGCLPEPF